MYPMTSHLMLSGSYMLCILCTHAVYFVHLTKGNYFKVYICTVMPHSLFTDPYIHCVMTSSNELTVRALFVVYFTCKQDKKNKSTCRGL